MNPNDITIRQPQELFRVYAFCALINSCLAFFILKEGIIYGFFFLFMALFFLLYIISFLRWKITVKGKQITHRPSFGKTKSFPINYITKAEHGTCPRGRHMQLNMEYIKAYHENKKLFSLKSNYENFYIFFSLLGEEGISIKGGKFSFFLY